MTCKRKAEMSPLCRVEISPSDVMETNLGGMFGGVDSEQARLATDRSFD